VGGERAAVLQHSLLDIVVLSDINEWLSVIEEQSSLSYAAIQKAVEECCVAK